MYLLCLFHCSLTTAYIRVCCLFLCCLTGRSTVTGLRFESLEASNSSNIHSLCRTVASYSLVSAYINNTYIQDELAVCL